VGEEGAGRAGVLPDKAVVAAGRTSGILREVVSCLVDVCDGGKARGGGIGSGTHDVAVGPAEGSGNLAGREGGWCDAEGIEGVEVEHDVGGSSRCGELA
jgi:hypothetical protein